MAKPQHTYIHKNKMLKIQHDSLLNSRNIIVARSVSKSHKQQINELQDLQAKQIQLQNEIQRVSVTDPKKKVDIIDRANSAWEHKEKLQKMYQELSATNLVHHNSITGPLPQNAPQADIFMLVTLVLKFAMNAILLAKEKQGN